MRTALLRKMEFSIKVVFVVVALLTVFNEALGQQCDCEPGQTRNSTDCDCEPTDGCVGQPCQNGGTCTSDLSAPSLYSCHCPANSTGNNCEILIIPCGDGCPDPECDTTLGCCANCSSGFIHDENNCTCIGERMMQPTNVCPSTCLESEVDHPTCCSVCPEGFELRSCQCVEEERQSLTVSQIAGIAIGLAIFVLLIVALITLLACMWFT